MKLVCFFFAYSRVGVGPQPREKKKNRKGKTDKKAPTSCEMERVFSVLLSGCGGLVACFFFLYALRFGSELHGYGKIGFGSELHGYDMRMGGRGTSFYAFDHISATTCEYVHLDINIKPSPVYISVLWIWNLNPSSPSDLTCQSRWHVCTPTIESGGIRRVRAVQCISLDITHRVRVGFDCRALLLLTFLSVYC
jgi:hypothetical protein